jgi:hypothetical protein
MNVRAAGHTRLCTFQESTHSDSDAYTNPIAGPSTQLWLFGREMENRKDGRSLSNAEAIGVGFLYSSLIKEKQLQNRVHEKGDKGKPKVHKNDNLQKQTLQELLTGACGWTGRPPTC